MCCALSFIQETEVEGAFALSVVSFYFLDAFVYDAYFVCNVYFVGLVVFLSTVRISDDNKMVLVLVNSRIREMF